MDLGAISSLLVLALVLLTMVIASVILFILLFDLIRAHKPSVERERTKEITKNDSDNGVPEPANLSERQAKKSGLRLGNLLGKVLPKRAKKPSGGSASPVETAQNQPPKDDADGVSFEGDKSPGGSTAPIPPKGTVDVAPPAPANPPEKVLDESVSVGSKPKTEMAKEESSMGKMQNSTEVQTEASPAVAENGDDVGEDEEPKIKIKPISSLEEAKALIEAKQKTPPVSAEAPSPLPQETEDVSAILGIKNNASQPNIENKNQAVVSMPAGDIADAPKKNSAEKVPEKPPEAPIGVAPPPESSRNDDEDDLETLLAADAASSILKKGDGMDEAARLSKQLVELKASLFELDKKLKSLKNNHE